MTRGLACVLVFAPLAAGCVGANPRWDGPEDRGEGPVVDDGTGSADTLAEETTGGGGASSSAAEGSWGEGEASSSTGSVANTETSSAVPTCEDDEIVCNGACTKADEDVNACGPECIDCIATLGTNAECKDGECRSSGGSGGESHSDEGD